jgi:hypothetical protein
MFLHGQTVGKAPKRLYKAFSMLAHVLIWAGRQNGFYGQPRGTVGHLQMPVVIHAEGVFIFGLDTQTRRLICFAVLGQFRYRGRGFQKGRGIE